LPHLRQSELINGEIEASVIIFCHGLFDYFVSQYDLVINLLEILVEKNFEHYNEIVEG
jgi:hypothetical protein